MESLKDIIHRNHDLYQQTETKEKLLFLDYDGVIDIDPRSFGMDPFNEQCIENVNDLCKKYELKVVVTSSYRNYAGYISALYISGLDEVIEVVGRTGNLGRKAEEIKDFIRNHEAYIEKFIILDDERLGDEFIEHQVRTRPLEGFTEQKYKEAEALLKKQDA